MSDSNKRKERIFQILAGSLQSGSGLDKKTFLEGMSEVDLGHLQDNTRSWFLIFIAVIATSGLYMLVPEVSASTSALWIMAIVVSLSFLCVVQEAFSASRKRKINYRLLMMALEDLEATLKYLQKYMADLDRRTSKYFHCVTNSKITSYFILTQISQRLSEKIHQVRETLAKPNRDSLLQAHASLSGTLSFRDGFDRNSGALHTVLLARIKTVVTELAAELDKSVNELEEDIVVNEPLAEE